MHPNDVKQAVFDTDNIWIFGTAKARAVPFDTVELLDNKSVAVFVWTK